MLGAITREHEYLTLAFAIRRHFPDFIDAYFGPPEIEQAAATEPDQTPGELLGRAHELATSIAASSYPESRKRYLSVQIIAMETISRRLAGEEIDYVDEVRACFDIEPEHVSESVFDASIAELDDLLPGDGDVRDRLLAWRAGYVVSPEVARRLIDLISEESRRRTEAIVPLPPGGVELALVSDKPWSGYNWYLGDFRSRVDINTDLPIHAHELIPLITHEAYPGHHAEHALKEQHLFREKGYGEHAIQLINTPECLISEGIAMLAESIVFPGDEGARWVAADLYPRVGIAGDPEREARIARARLTLRAARGNAALMAHVKGVPDDEVVAYLMRYELSSAEKARQGYRFITDPTWRPYTFAYHVGRDLLGRWLDLAPPGERAARFRSLLVDQHTPSQLAAEIEGHLYGETHA